MPLAVMASVASCPQQSSAHFDKLNLIWQVGSASLSSTGNELRLPLNISENMRPDELQELELRLSQKFDGAPTFMFPDKEMDVFRICVVPASPELSSTATSPASGPYVGSAVVGPKARAHGKKSKVPRPPNAFILYRQKMHPQIKAANPDMHNNDISVILGRKWKSESEQIKDFFKLEAEKMKLQHAIDNPGYQYTPRRPSEKKRRMTARKLANLKQIENGTSDFPPANAISYNDAGLCGLPGQPVWPTMDAALNIKPLTSNKGISFTEDQDVQLSMPSPDSRCIEAFNFTTAHYNAAQNNLNNIANATHSTGIPDHILNTNTFLTSTVDWEAIQDDFNYFTTQYNDFKVEIGDLDEVDDSMPHFSPLGEAELAAFDEELQRTLELFE